MTDFWNAAAGDAPEPLTAELLQDMLDGFLREMRESALRPYECPHRTIVFPAKIARQMNGKPCPYGCGRTLHYDG